MTSIPPQTGGRRTPAGPGVLGGRAKALHSLQKQEAESLKNRQKQGKRTPEQALLARRKGEDPMDTKDKKRNVKKGADGGPTYCYAF